MKKLFLILGIPVALIVIAMAALVFFVNPNQFKPLIVEQTKQQTGLDLNIQGDISWNFFPSLGLSLGQTELKNPEGFKNANLLKIDAISVDVSVMPLLDNELFIGNVALDGAEIHIETLKDGTSNLDALTTAKADTQSSTEKSSVDQGVKSEDKTSSEVSQDVQAEAKPEQPWSVNLAGISITNALLEIRDDKAGSYTKLYDVGLAVSEFAFAEWTTATFEAKGKANQQSFVAKGSADFKLAQDLATYELKNINVESSFSNPTTDISTIKLGLETFAFDQVNPLTLAVKGKAADMKIDMGLAASLLVDKAINQIRMENMVLDSTFEGEALPQSPMNIDGKLAFGFVADKQQVSLDIESLALNDLKLDGNATVKLADIPAVRFSIYSPNIDLDEFLGLNKQQTASSEKQPVSSEKSNGATDSESQVAEEPDLSALKTLDVAGSVKIDNFKANNAKMQNVNAKFSVNRGVVTLSSFSSDLYEGSIKASAKLDGRKTPATYSVNNTIKGVHVQPLLKDVADNDMLEGTGNIEMAITGKSLIPDGIKQNLDGVVKIDFADGAVNGINIAQEVRSGYAKIKGESLSDEDKEEKKTDFSALQATFNLSKGVAKTDDMSIQSPLLRVHGEGEANYIKETMDFMIDTSFVGSLKGQGGKDIDDLRDVTIPVRLYNKWAEPKYKVEFSALWKKIEDDKKKELEEKAKKEAERGLKKLLGDKGEDDKVKEATNKLLNKLFH